jgi:hypothetical protein
MMTLLPNSNFLLLVDFSHNHLSITHIDFGSEFKACSQTLAVEDIDSLAN